MARVTAMVRVMARVSFPTQTRSHVMAGWGYVTSIDPDSPIPTPTLP